MAKIVRHARGRQLSDAEIGLVKAMLSKGWQNDAVHFFFNRAERLISPGRITQIKNKEYGSSVPQASEAILDKFLAEWRLKNEKIPQGKRAPISRDLLVSMFEITAGTWTLAGGETDTVECKQSFRVAPQERFAVVVRAIAGLANNKGGYILFGIKDGTFDVVGVGPGFEDTDPALINSTLAGCLDPIPRVLKAVVTVGDYRVGVLYVEPHDDAPVIALKNIDGGTVREGGVYYRYVGETRLIKPAELRQIINRRVQRGLAEFAKKMTRVAIGAEATIDLDVGRVEGATGRFLLDKELLKQIQFIREGDFSEVKGAPALRLIGEVEPVSAVERERVKVIRNNITPDDVVRNFLLDEVVAEPLQYILAQVHQQRKWMPVWHYVRMSGKAPEEIVAELNQANPTHPASRSALIERLSGRVSAMRITTGQPARELQKLVNGEIVPPVGANQDLMFCLGVQGLPANFAHAGRLRELVFDCFERAKGDDKKTASRRSVIYRAACRLDELTR